MNKLLPPPVDTFVEHRPWWGKRVRIWWMHSTTGWVLSSLLFASCLGLWIYGILFPAADPLPGSPSAPTAAAPQDSGASPEPINDLLPSPSVTCPPQVAVQLAPEQVALATFTPTWYPVGTMAAPKSAAAGPTDARHCFARSPEGALYATATRLAEQASGLTGTHFSGYQWLSYSPDHTALVLRMSVATSLQTSYVARVFMADWVGNDWQAAPDTSTDAATAAADPKRIFTPWRDS